MFKVSGQISSITGKYGYFNNFKILYGFYEGELFIFPIIIIKNHIATKSHIVSNLS